MLVGFPRVGDCVSAVGARAPLGLGQTRRLVGADHHDAITPCAPAHGAPRCRAVRRCSCTRSDAVRGCSCRSDEPLTQRRSHALAQSDSDGQSATAHAERVVQRVTELQRAFDAELQRVMDKARPQRLDAERATSEPNFASRSGEVKPDTSVARTNLDRSAATFRLNRAISPKHQRQTSTDCVDGSSTIRSASKSTRAGVFALKILSTAKP